jgi:aminoglycoside phosphotransferase (APT) family kinase protein
MQEVRAPGRIPMPDLGQIMQEANDALRGVGLAECTHVKPMPDGDTMNPQVIGYAAGPQYVIKVVFPHATQWQHKDHHAGARAANVLRERTALPIPQHYSVVDEPGRLPLVIMQCMPGEQLARLLPTANAPTCHAVCEDWGRCLARFHDPALTDILNDPSALDREIEHDAGWAAWYLQKHADSDWHRTHADRILAFLHDRLPLTGRYELPAVTKHGLDVRDFVATTEPTPRITGMLDWEGITAGDGVVDLVGIWVRLHYLGVGYAAPSFLKGYEAERGITLRQTKRVEFHLMNRALLPTNHNEASRVVVDELISGATYPFDQRTGQTDLHE